MRRALVGIALVVGALMAWAGPASAHATLEATSPADRAHLDTAPSVVTLSFSENVSASLGAVKVVSSSGQRVDNGNLEVQGKTVTLGLQSGVGDGSYIVTWRVISADSHPVRGAFTFSVGSGGDLSSAQIAQATNDSGDRDYDVAAWVFRCLAYGGALLAAGGGLFLVVAHDGGEERAGLVRIVTVSAVVAVVGIVANIPVQAALATGLGLSAVKQSAVLGDVLSDGVWPAAVVTIAGLVLLRTALRRSGSPPSGRRTTAVIVGGALAAGGFALSGHTRQSAPVWLASLSDLVHLLAGAVWLGGAVFLAIVLRRRKTGDATAAGEVTKRFSALATIAVLVVGVTGLVLGIIEVGSLGDLTSTRYGWLLVAKVAFVAGIAALGAYNHYRLVPALASAPKTATSRLRTTVAMEAVAMLFVIGVTGVLVNTTPAKSTETGVQSVTAPLGSGTVNVVVDPARVGFNSIHLYVLDQAGRNQPVQSVNLELSMPSSDIGPIQRAAFVAGQGHYQYDGSDFTVAGEWSIKVVATIDKFTEQTATVKVTIHR